MSKKRIISQIDFQCPGFPEFGWQEHVDILWGIYSMVTQVKLPALGTGLQGEAITQFVTMFPCTLLYSAALYFICNSETCTGVYLVYVNKVTGRLFQECWVRGTGKVPHPISASVLVTWTTHTSMALLNCPKMLTSLAFPTELGGTVSVSVLILYIDSLPLCLPISLWISPAWH